jgi:soluble lytic murein transglycosylase
MAAAGPASAQTTQQHGVTIVRPAPSGAPDSGIRRVPQANGPAVQQATPAPATSPTLPIAPGTGSNNLLPAGPPSETAQAIASTTPLGEAEAAALGSALKAIDEGRYGDARASVKDFNNPLLAKIVDWNVLRAAPKTDADFASTWRFLRQNPDWPEPEVLRRLAEDRIGPEVPAQQVFAYFTAFPPLTSAGHLRRLEAAASVSPANVPKFASDSWRSATFKQADENEFLNKYGHLLKPEDNIARFDRILHEGRTQVASQLLSRLPPEYQPIATARLAMASKAADAVTVLRGVAPASLNEPTMRFERLQWMRRTGKLDDAKSLLLSPVTGQTDAWWNERQQIARDLLAAGRAADAYAIVQQHGQTKGVAFAEAEFLAGWIALRHLRKPAEGMKHFQTLYDGVSSAISKSRAAYWMGRALEASGKSKDATEWFGRAAAFGQTFYGQTASPCRAASWSPSRAISDRPRPTSRRVPSCCNSHASSRDRAKRSCSPNSPRSSDDRTLPSPSHGVRPSMASPCSTPPSRSSTSATRARSNARWRWR